MVFTRAIVTIRSQFQSIIILSYPLHIYLHENQALDSVRG